jgi:hypothetical protein
VCSKLDIYVFMRHPIEIVNEPWINNILLFILIKQIMKIKDLIFLSCVDYWLEC